MAGEPLTALIGAYEPGPAGLRALMPLAGATLVEQQARRAFAAGASHVLLLIDVPTPDLVTAVGRLRQDGLAVGLAEGIDAAADALSGQTVLLIADACLPEPDLLRDLLALPVPAVATLADVPEHARHERIDAHARWAGIALIDGHRVAETATILGSWDPVSTLLRRAVQDGAARLAVDIQPPALLVDQASMVAADAAILAAARRRGSDWISRTVFAPAEELAVPLLLARRIDAAWLALGSGLLGVSAGALAWAGARWPALIALLAAGPIAAGAARLARVRARPIALGWIADAARLIGASVAVIGLGAGQVRATGQWGWWLVVLLVVAATAALAALGRLRRGGQPLWTASADVLAWSLVPFAALGRWEIGLMTLAGYAWLSFGWVLARMALQVEKDGVEDEAEGAG